jgi:hypothetical protein
MSGNQAPASSSKPGDAAVAPVQPGPSAAPAITLPKGGGAIRGIDEKSSVNPATGTASLSVPISTRPSRADFHPKLSLSYDSGSGNGLFGLGWSLSLPAITRKTDKGLPRYQDGAESDTFILSAAENLVPVLIYHKDRKIWEAGTDDDRQVGPATYSVKRYRRRIEGLFACIERWWDRHQGQLRLHENEPLVRASVPGWKW